ncbi:T9SS type A sorting domain-containing protein [Vitellibacter sp. q18]|nr:T9SS type A sorting domain-containing protein [Aequorivita lutea]
MKIVSNSGTKQAAASIRGSAVRFFLITNVKCRIVRSPEKLVSNKIEASAIKAGMYFITLTTSEGRVTKKFIKN